MRTFIASLLFASLIVASVSAEEFALPRVGTIGDAPPRARTLGVTVERNGTVRVGKQEIRFAELRALLAQFSRLHHRGNARASAANVLLRIDARVPWIATQWVLTACAEQRIARVFYGVLPESGLAEGALALFLPTDKGIRPTAQEPDEVLSLPVRISYRGTGVHPAALYPLLMKFPEKVRKEAVLDLRAMPNVPHGFALQVVDVAMRAGITEIEIFGTMIPPHDADLKAIVKKHAPPKGNPGIRLGAADVQPAEVKMPAVARVTGRFAGNAPAAGDEPEPPNEEIAEEPIETDEFDDDDMDDSPFTGPSTNRAVGIGGGAGKKEAGRSATRKSAPLSATENAVQRGLAWLASAQDEKSAAWPSPGAKHDVAATGLSLLAFLGAGYTDRGSAKENPYAATVRNGLRYLMERQREDGGFGAGEKSIYDSAIAATALTEAYWMTRNPRYKKPAQEAINFLASARNPYGGWGDGVRTGNSNTAATVWCFFAMKSGKFAGLDVDPDAFEGTRVWIEKMTDATTGRAGYDKRGAGVFRPKELANKFPADKSRAMTAAAMLARIFLGEDPRQSANVRKGATECLKRPPVWNLEDGSIDMTYWYFGTLAMFQVGGAHWRAWNTSMKSAIVESQVKDGAKQAGSWDPVGPWGSVGGRVYATALMTMCLEVYYRYDRVFGTK